jgi:2'-5' RNA ligase
LRLFVALDIPQAARDALAEPSKRLAKLCSGARWVHLEGAHLTVKFIGEVPAETAERIRLALAEVRAIAPVELRFAGLGFFPDAKRPRVFWAGIESNPALGELFTAIEARLAPLGVARETREFRPHITLARFRSAEGIGPLRAAVEELGMPEFGRLTTREFHVYQSVLQRAGAEYTRLATYVFSREPAS